MKLREIFARLKPVETVVFELPEVEVLNARLHEIHARLGEVLA